MRNLQSIDEVSTRSDNSSPASQESETGQVRLLLERVPVDNEEQVEYARDCGVGVLASKKPWLSWSMALLVDDCSTDGRIRISQKPRPPPV